MRINLPITFAIICLSVSIALIVLTFVLEYWIQVIVTKDNYGMWRACLANSVGCYSWYASGEQVFNFTLNNFNKAFQGLQCVMLGLAFVSLTSIFINLMTCPKMSRIYFVDSILIFIGVSCGIISLVFYGVKVYDSSLHYLTWCYWVNVAAVALQVIAIFLIVVYAVGIMRKSGSSLSSSTLELANDEERNDKKSKKNIMLMNTPTTSNANTNIANIPVEYPGNPNFSLKKKESNKHKPLDINYNVSSPKPNRVSKEPIIPKGHEPSEINPDKSANQSPRFKKANQNRPKADKSLERSKINSKPRARNDFDSHIYENGSPSVKPKNHSNHNYRYRHKHHIPGYHQSKEKFQPGYSSEPDVIEYSLDRSWLSHPNNLNQSLPTDINENGITDTFHSRHFVKLPKLVYYNGYNHYSRPDFKKH